ncbi:MAG TPA: GNAT family N-acetyltransferase, partial [Nocardioides sp.]|nr:GNAT family N-acetyltransferase [Nocardioides sp.]
MPDVPPYLMETERLRLVPLDATRADELAAIYADPEVARYIGGDALDAEGTRTQVERFEAVWREHGYGQSALLARDTGLLVGRAGLHPWPVWEELELGYALARA